MYCRNVRSVMKDGSESSDYHYDPQTQKLTVPFAGPANLLLMGADGLFD